MRQSLSSGWDAEASCKMLLPPGSSTWTEVYWHVLQERQAMCKTGANWDFYFFPTYIKSEWTHKTGSQKLDIFTRQGSYQIFSIFKIKSSQIFVSSSFSLVCGRDKGKKVSFKYAELCYIRELGHNKTCLLTEWNRNSTPMPGTTLKGDKNKPKAETVIPRLPWDMELDSLAWLMVEDGWTQVS